MRTLSASLASLALLACAPALSAEDAASPPPPAASPQPSAGSGPTIIVTAQRQEEDAARSTASTTTLTADDLHDRGYATSAHDYLRGVAGVDVRQSGGYGGTVDVQIRGASSYDTQVLLDGIPFNDPSATQGNPDLGLLNPAGLGRIEVVKGAQSGLWGSRAVGGVINLISQRPTAATSGEARVEAGSYDDYQAAAALSGPLGDGLGFALGVDALTVGGVSAKTDDPQGRPGDHERDGFTRLGVNGRFEARADSGAVGYLGVNALTATSRFDGDRPDFSGDPDDAQSLQQERIWRGSGGGEVPLGDDLRLLGDLAETGIDRRYPNETQFDQDYATQETYASLRLRDTHLEHLALTLGGDGTWSRFASKFPGGASDIDAGDHLIGVWAQVLLTTRRAELSLVGRHDEHSQGGGASTYRVAGALFPVVDRCKVFASVASAFRAPSLFELYAPPFFGSPTGNADLHAQKSTSYEAGASAFVDQVFAVTATAFHTDYDQQIAFDFTQGYTNAPGAAVRGVEAELDAGDEAAGPSGRLAWTWQQSEDAGGVPTVFVPTQKFSAGARWAWARAWVSGRVDAVGQRTDADHADLPGYALLGAAAGWTVLPHAELYVRGDNLAGARYVEVRGFGTTFSTMGRSGAIGLRAWF
jgi:vitamin B12 transporter